MKPSTDINPHDDQDSISAFVDGEALLCDCQGLFDSGIDSAHRLHVQAWTNYQFIGQVMRGEEGVSARSPLDFADEFRRRLAADNAALASESPASGGVVMSAHPLVVAPERRVATNQSHWKWAVGFASVATLGVLTWYSTHQLQQPVAAQVASQTSTTTSTQEVVWMVSPEGQIMRDPRLDALLAQHKQMGGVSALQTPVGFLRNATFEPASIR